MAIKSLKSGSYGRSVMAGNSLILPGDYESIATVTPTSGTSITFSSIPQTFKHLQIRGTIKASGSDNLYLRFNGDTGANYTGHQVYGDGTGAGAGVAYNMWYVASGTVPGVGVLDILDYTNTNKLKVYRSLGGSDSNGGGYVLYRSGLWFAAGNGVTSNAITQIDILFAGATAFSAGSHIALYGIRG